MKQSSEPLTVEIPVPIVGVTIEDLPQVDDPKFGDLERALRLIGSVRTPTLRVVFQIGDEASKYKEALQRLRGTGGRSRVAYVMGLLGDSDLMWAYNDEHQGDHSHEDWLTHVDEYLTELGDCVDLWEVGNEVNGEWAGWKEDETTNIRDGNASQTRHTIRANSDETTKIRDWHPDDPRRMARMRATIGRQTLEAFDAVKKNRKTWNTPTALTLYYYSAYNPQCTPDILVKGNIHYPIDYGDKYKMLTWARENLFKSAGRTFTPDYVLISLYEDDCDGQLTSASNWVKLFQDLTKLFPAAKYGFGETGSHCYGSSVSESRSCVSAQIINVRQHYGDLHREINRELAGINGAKPTYIGGFFNWFFGGQMLSGNNPILEELVAKVRAW